jgi:hypothetical protein
MRDGNKQQLPTQDLRLPRSSRGGHPRVAHTAYDHHQPGFPELRLKPRKSRLARDELDTRTPYSLSGPCGSLGYDHRYVLLIPPSLDLGSISAPCWATPLGRINGTQRGHAGARPLDPARTHARPSRLQLTSRRRRRCVAVGTAEIPIGHRNSLPLRRQHTET